MFDLKAIGQKMCRKKHINVLKGIRSKKGRKVNSIDCLKIDHMVEMLIFSFGNMTGFEAND